MNSLLDWFNQPDVITTIIAFGSMGLFFIGLFGLLTQRHLIKIFISVSLMEAAVFLYFLGTVFHRELTAPILGDGHTTFTGMNDPIPHAMILTAIVIGMALFALGVSFAIEYYKLTRRTDINTMKELGE